jgi:hypothetical protein
MKFSGVGMVSQRQILRIFRAGNDSTHSEFGAGNGARTRGIKLGKLALYQLSYSRLSNIIKELKKEIKRSFEFFTAFV